MKTAGRAPGNAAGAPTKVPPPPTRLDRRQVSRMVRDMASNSGFSSQLMIERPPVSM